MKIICIGRNYSDHVHELNNELPSEPLFFLKPDSSVLHKRHAFYIPEWTSDVHYEVEVVVKILKRGKAVLQKFASRYYCEVGLGIDFTARDVQTQLKQAGHPWEKAKAFDGSAVISDKFIPLDELGKDIQDLRFSLLINNREVQLGHTAEMIFSVDNLIVYLSKYMTLKTGDLIFTGTPSGVAKVSPNDRLVGFIEEKEIFSIKVK